MWDTCLVNGTDLETIGWVETFDGLSSEPPTDQDPIVIPGRAGAVFVAGQWAAYTFPVPVTVTGATVGEVNTKLDALTALVDSRAAALTVTRQRTVGVAQTSQTAECVQVSGLQPQWIGHTAARVEVMFQNLSGAWT